MTKTKNQYHIFYTYKITNIVTNKIYIGETYNVQSRFRKHFASAKYGSKSYLHCSMRKHGKNNFIIETINSFPTEQEALCDEIKLINELKSNKPDIGYNLTSGGDKTTHSEQTLYDMKEKSLELWNNKDYVSNCLMAKLGFTISDLIDIGELRISGVKMCEIAKIYNVERHTISNILSGKTWNKILPFKPIINIVPDEQDVYKVRELVNSGKTYKEVGKLLNISHSKAKRMAKGHDTYAKYNKIPPVKNLKIIDENTITLIRGDYKSLSPTLVSLSEKYNLCTNIISDIVCGTNNYSHLPPLTCKMNKKFEKYEIENIMLEYKSLSVSELSKKYNVDYKTIYNIVNYKSYKNR